jgi:hypothetical protein
MDTRRERGKRYTVVFKDEVVGRYDTAGEVKAHVAKRLDRQYVIFDRRKRVELKDLED